LSASHKKKLEEIGAGYCATLLRIGGVTYRRLQAATVAYHSLCGTVEVSRWLYRKQGVRNGPTVVPLELAAGLMERATPALAYRIALGDAQCPGRQWEQQLVACHRRPPSRSTLERIAKNLGSAVRQAAPELLAIVRAAEPVEAEAVAISVGLDRTSIPMEEPLRKGDSRNPQLHKRTKPYVRRPPRPAEVHYRMGYVGTVNVTGRDGESIRTMKYACSADADPAQLVDQALADVISLQQRRRYAGLQALPLGVVQDGAPEMWRLAEEGLSRGLPGFAYDKAIDRYHLMERLAEALTLLRLPQLERGQLLAQWRHDLDHDDAAIVAIHARLKREMRKPKVRPMSRTDAEIINSHDTYIRNNKANMRYASMRDKGLPTGSGATEGACKSAIMIRAKGCGQRWHPPGVNSVLTLRSLWLSDRLPAAWGAFRAISRVEIAAA
jgi:hypothetical protein